jgi:preprotein translocase subunit YajC
MNHLVLIHASAGTSSGETNPMASFVLMAVLFGIFWFVLILPMRKKQKKLEELVKGIKSGDRVVLSSGILGQIAAVEEDTFLVRIDEKTKVKVLKSAVAGLQGSPIETEQK